jgi:hypothetical protein
MGERIGGDESANAAAGDQEGRRAIAMSHGVFPLRLNGLFGLAAP